MIVMTRGVGEAIRIETPNGEVIEVIVTRVAQGKCRLGVDFPLSCKVMRKEIFESFTMTDPREDTSSQNE